MMNNNNSTYKRLGDYIEQRREKNKGYDVPIRGVSREGFIPPKQQDADVSLYNVFYKNDFVFNPARMELNSIALNEELEQGICSSLYEIFYIKDTNILDPLYLNLLIKTDHFTRFCEFVGWGSVREYCRFADISEYYIEVPPIEEQHKIVSHFNAIRTRIANNKQTIVKLEEAAQALYRKMFVDDVDVENLPDGWRMGCLGEVAEYYNKKINTSSLSNKTYISTENLLKDKKGIITIDSVPEGRCNEFKKNMILLSNIRPYFKKLWKASFDGGCSADVLCFAAKEGIPSDFLYYTMADDSFFEHVVSGSNGVKMPRGDKDWTIKYPIVIPNSTWLNEFQKKVKNLVSYSKEIQLENEKLTEMLSMMMA